MRNLFSMDSGLFRFLSKLADLMILNIIFLICCVPVVTIGASVTALSYVTLKMKDNEEGYIIRTFFRSFKQNLKQSTVIWLVMLFLALVLGLDFYLVRQMEGTMAMVMQVLVYMGTVIWLMVFLYVFPMQSRFYNTIRGTVRNAILLALGNFPKTFCMMAVTVGAVILTFWNQYTFWYGMLFWILVGFAVIGWANSQFLHGILLKLMPEEIQETEEDSSEEDPETETKKIEE